MLHIFLIKRGIRVIFSHHFSLFITEKKFHRLLSGKMIKKRCKLQLSATSVIWSKISKSAWHRQRLELVISAAATDALISSIPGRTRVSMQYLSVYCTLLHHVIECTPKCSELSMQYQCTVVNKNSRGCWNSVVRIQKRQIFASITSMDSLNLLKFY